MRGFSFAPTRIAALGFSGIGSIGLVLGARADEQTTPKTEIVSGSRLTETAAKKPLLPPIIEVAQMPPVSLMDSALMSATIAAPKARQLDPVSVASKVVPIAIRLGALVSPRTKFVGGADFSFPSLKVGPIYGRIDAEAIVSANFGAVSTIVPITFNGVYAKPLAAGGRIYVGGGIGPYFGEVTRFGGKLFVGGDFNNRIGLEADLHFAGQGEALVSVMARIGL